LLKPNQGESRVFETFFFRACPKQFSDNGLLSLPGCGNLPRLNFDVAVFWRQLYTKWPLPVSMAVDSTISVYK
jgi:hypothetical protein